ncbi:MAG TPA: multicopper oxidase domain-containing protein, partial [Chlamydiales bacterium]|nr:multicopper oxidase domain-containing protein [Chlamydiales bacterium]
MNRWAFLFFFSTTFLVAQEIPPEPWKKIEAQHLNPGLPLEDYTPVVVPNGAKLDFKIVDGIKVFHLIAEPIVWEVAGGLKINTWGFNGSVPGPLIEAVEGDRVRIYVTNKLPASTTVHWHG